MSNSRFDQKLLLRPPGRWVMSSLKLPTEFVRFASPRHMHDADALWDGFADRDFSWAAANRFAGSGINPGYFFCISPEAVEAEMNFYNPGVGWKETKAKLTIASTYSNLLNLTEPDMLAFIFDHLIEFPYRRRTFQLALLASTARGGNPICDYIGGWAYQKGFNGLVFLSARAIEPIRAAFDISNVYDIAWSYYWSAAGDEFDYVKMWEVETHVRANVGRYINFVFFRGAEVIYHISRARVDAPDGNVTNYTNPYYQASVTSIREGLAFSVDAEREATAIKRMHALQDQIDRMNREAAEIIDPKNRRSNPDMGEELVNMFF